ncbi:MAG: cytochrome c [Alphaproteobacteria bacterium]
MRWIVGAVLLAAAAAPAQAADAEAGARLAQQWCSGCHSIGGKPGPDAAPPLPPGPSRDAEWVRGWLHAPHPPMPDLQLGRQQVDDLVAYLETLRGR